MNLLHFLDTVDAITADMSKEGLASFVHESARVLDEAGRTAFLERLNEAGQEVTPSPACSSRQADLEKTLTEIMADLQAVDEGEVCLGSDYNSDYDDWYNPNASEFLFTDDDGVADIVEKAVAFVHDAISGKAYAMAYGTGDYLMQVSVEAEGAYNDCMGEPLYLEDLIEEDIVQVDYRDFVTAVLYAAYLDTDPQDRVEELERIFSNYQRRDIRMEDVMQYGEELPGLDDFLKKWLSYLGHQSGGSLHHLLVEAAQLVNDSELLLTTARECHEWNPCLYEQYLQMYADKVDTAELLTIGEEALDRIDPNLRIRGQIALLCARYASQAGRKEQMEDSLFEAFRSDTTIVNYMRLRWECVDFAKYETQVREIYHAFCEQLLSKESRRTYYSSGTDDRETNRPDRDTVFMLAFLGGEFRYVAENAMNVKESLGWSSTFMKCGIAAFLLLLLEGEKLPQGCNAMRRRLRRDSGFTVEAYNAGFLHRAEGSDDDCFWRFFLQWKQETVLTEAQLESCMQWLEGLVQRRVDGIMGANRRNYYGECAEFIAAVGEVRESWGDQGAKQRVMEDYRMQYSRRRLFVDALRVCGLADHRRKT